MIWKNIVITDNITGQNVMEEMRHFHSVFLARALENGPVALKHPVRPRLRSYRASGIISMPEGSYTLLKTEDWPDNNNSRRLLGFISETPVSYSSVSRRIIEIRKSLTEMRGW